MTHTVQIDHLTYNADADAVTAAISGELGGRHVHVQVQFPLRASTQRDDEARRQSAIAELQQILRAASTVTIVWPEEGTARASAKAPHHDVSRWDDEGGSAQSATKEVVWV